MKIAQVTYKSQSYTIKFDDISSLKKPILDLVLSLNSSKDGVLKILYLDSEGDDVVVRDQGDLEEALDDH